MLTTLATDRLAIIAPLLSTGAALGPQLYVGQEPSAATFRPPTMRWPRAMKKPGGGLWTSTLKPGPSSGWVEWCQSEMLGWIEKPWWRLDPAPDAKIVVLDTLDDLRRILRAYPFLDDLYDYSKPHRAFLKQYNMEPDYAAMLADGIDGVNLTDAGQWATRLYAPNLYGWDAESTVFLRWQFVAVTPASPGGVSATEVPAP